MAVHNIRRQQDLAARLGWPPARVNKTLGGSQRWTLDDLTALGTVFGVTPAALLSDTAELVGAGQPATDHGDIRQVTVRYGAPNSATVIPFPLATAMTRRYRNRPSHNALSPITAGQAACNVTRLIGRTGESVTRTTAAVGT